MRNPRMYTFNAIEDAVRDGVIIMTWKDGTIDRFSVTDLPPDIKNLAMVHGLRQKRCDSFAGISDPAEARAEMARVDEALRAGTWKSRAAAGERETPTRLLAEAVVAAYAAVGETLDLQTVVSRLEGMNRKERAEWRNHPDVARQLVEIQARNAAPRSLTMGAFAPTPAPLATEEPTATPTPKHTKKR